MVDLYRQKKDDCWLWWAVDRASKSDRPSEGVCGKPLNPTPAEKVEWVEADEWWTYIAKKKMIAGSGGLLIVLPNRSWGGRWGIVEPKRPSGWRRNCLTPPRSSLPPTSGIPTRKSSAAKTMSKARH